ncbi:hypothetical protein C1N64_12795 [Pantoea sp. SGAir0215]|nr:hypothetical protein RSA30_09260 [Pantoea stewartii]
MPFLTYLRHEEATNTYFSVRPVPLNRVLKRHLIINCAQLVPEQLNHPDRCLLKESGKTRAGLGSSGLNPGSE